MVKHCNQGNLKREGLGPVIVLKGQQSLSPSWRRSMPVSSRGAITIESSHFIPQTTRGQLGMVQSFELSKLTHSDTF